MITISTNIGPEIILAWSSLGLIIQRLAWLTPCTLHLKMVPRIIILGLSIGFALATAWWSFTLVLLALVT